MARPSRQMVLLALCACAALGCRDLSRFDTEGNEAYCGRLVNSPVLQEGFVPENVVPNLRLSFQLDTDTLTSVPGVLSTDDAPPKQGLCSAEGRPLIDQAPLRAIEELSHDPLSMLEFGDGRDHNFFGWVDSTCQGTMLAVVSLMNDEKVEVRLLKPAPLPAPEAPPESRPGFALFPMTRQKQGCGF